MTESVAALCAGYGGLELALQLCVYAFRAGREWTPPTGTKVPNFITADSYRHGQPGKVDHPTQKPMVEGTEEFNAYITDMQWAQRYAFENRQTMMNAITNELATLFQNSSVLDGPPINCHHNYTTQEKHHGRDMWITRKGAIMARAGSLGVIPGSMATGSFIVEGLGSRASYASASHGAGRKMSRTAARKALTAESLDGRMADIAWNEQPEALLDEHPDAYKDLGQVMENQKDLVTILHQLTTILNYKGT